MIITTKQQHQSRTRVPDMWFQLARYLAIFQHQILVLAIKERTTGYLNHDTHTHNHIMALLDFVRDHPGEPASER